MFLVCLFTYVLDCFTINFYYTRYKINPESVYEIRFLPKWPYLEPFGQYIYIYIYIYMFVEVICDMAVYEQIDRRMFVVNRSQIVYSLIIAQCLCFAARF